MSWNYRVFRGIDPIGAPYYDIRETYYDAGGALSGWTDGTAPMGNTFRELIGDLAAFMAALTRPIIDDKTGLECEPAQMVGDELQQWIDSRASTKGEA